jgi:hypothetical protein
VDVARTALAGLRGILRLLAAARLTRLLAVGVVSTVAYALLFLLARVPVRLVRRRRRDDRRQAAARAVGAGAVGARVRLAPAEPAASALPRPPARAPLFASAAPGASPCALTPAGAAAASAAHGRAGTPARCA